MELTAAEPQREWQSRPLHKSPDPREDGGLPRSTQHRGETRRPTGTRAEAAAWRGRSPGSPGPNDGLAGITGGRVVCAVEVQPQQDLAPPLGLGVQDLDTGSHPGQRCIGAGPAGQGSGGFRRQAKASGCPLRPPRLGQGSRARGEGTETGIPRCLPARHSRLLQLGPPQGAGGPGPGPKPPEAATPTHRSTVS